MKHALFQIVTAQSTHYLRAQTAMHARVRAWKTWGEKISTCFAVPSLPQGYGARGYNSIVNPPEGVEDYDVKQYIIRTTGKQGNKVNSFYRKSEEQKVARAGNARKTLQAIMGLSL